MTDAPPIVITADHGGVLGDYLARRAQYLADGRRIEIRGDCESSCTVFASLPGVCVGTRASLGFHAPTQRMAGRVIDSGASFFGQIMMANYPARVQDWIVRNGGLTERMIHLRGRELRAMFRECE